jgi:hypothetical protein
VSAIEFGLNFPQDHVKTFEGNNDYVTLEVEENQVYILQAAGGLVEFVYKQDTNFTLAEQDFILAENARIVLAKSNWFSFYVRAGARLTVARIITS